MPKFAIPGAPQIFRDQHGADTLFVQDGGTEVRGPVKAEKFQLGDGRRAASLSALSPLPLSNYEAVAAGTGARPLEVFDNYLWGRGSGGFGSGEQIYRSNDGGRSWELYAAVTPADTIIRLIPTPDGEVVAVMRTTVVKSSGWATGSPTWTTKIPAFGGAHFVSYSVGAGNPVDPSGERSSHIIVGPYAALSFYADSRQVHLSTDGGDTWALVWDTAVRSPTDNPNTHLHGMCYDPWEDRWWVSEGHTASRGLYYSEDDGATWTKLTDGAENIDAAGPTVVIATNNGLVLGTDGPPNGLHAVRRVSDSSKMRIDQVVSWRGEVGVMGFGERAYRDPATGIVYVGFVTSHAGLAPIIAASDALTGAIVYKPEDALAAGLDRYGDVVVIGDELVGHHTESGAGFIFRAQLRSPGALPTAVTDPGGVLGGQAPDSRSVAIGVRSLVTGDRDVVIGVKSNSGPGTSFYGRVAIGFDAKATGNHSTAIGMAAEAAFESTTIGHEAGIAGGSRAVHIGYRAVAAASCIAIGHDTKASGVPSLAVGTAAQATVTESTSVGNSASVTGVSGTALGHAASVTSTDGVAVGRGASAAANGTAIGRSASAGQNQSVALGRGSTATGPYQVAIGPRSIFFSTTTGVGGDPVAPTGGFVLFARTVSDKVQVCVRYPSGLIAVLNEEL